MAAEAEFVQIIVGIGILLFAAKLMAELFLRLKLPIVLGELLAGMIVGPFALGSFLTWDGQNLLEIGPELRTLGQMGAIVILFMAGLEMTPKEFIRGGKASFTVGTLGVVIPFFVGLLAFQSFGYDALQSMMIATALTATSIAISIQVLNEFGKIKTPEARLIIGAAVIDDILAIAVLSVVSSIATDGTIDDISIAEVTFVILEVLGFFAVMLLAAVFLVPKIVSQKIWKARGGIEGIVTAIFFGAAALAGSLGLSPIVGAFAVGMALSTTKVFEKVEDYIGKVGLIFAPLFFAIIGAEVDFTKIDLNILALSGIVIVIAVATKLLGCGLPAAFFLKNRRQGMRVGIGMVSRGEVGLIVAGVGVSLSILTSEVYSTIILMVAVTTIITPIWLKIEYRREAAKGGGEPESVELPDHKDGGEPDSTEPKGGEPEGVKLPEPKH